MKPTPKQKPAKRKSRPAKPMTDARIRRTAKTVVDKFARMLSYHATHELRAEIEVAMTKARDGE